MSTSNLTLGHLARPNRAAVGIATNSRIKPYLSKIRELVAVFFSKVKNYFVKHEK